MKDTFKILFKLCLLFLILYFPIFHGSHEIFSAIDFNLVLFNQNKYIESIKIDEFNMMNMVSKEDIPYREIDIDPIEDVIEIPKAETKKKRIYIYSTHQKEAYKDKSNVKEASIVLKDKLIEYGYDVIVENRDFPKLLNDLGYDYSQSYLISRSAIQDALIKHEGFDLIIDFHRDSIPRNTATIQSNDKVYAKMMVVLGGLSSHFDANYKLAKTLSDKSNQLEKGIMKNILVREDYYNQDLSKNMLLIEVGSDENYYSEVLNSIEILSKAIYEIVG